MSKILEPQFSNNNSTDELVLRTYMQKHWCFVAAQQSTMDQRKMIHFVSIWRREQVPSAPWNSVGWNSCLLQCNLSARAVWNGAFVIEEREQLTIWRISELARGILAIQASSVAAERAFSRSGRIVDGSRYSLSDEYITAQILLQCWNSGLVVN